MKSTTTASSVASNQQETYTRTRDDPFFDGMRRGEAAVVNKGSAFDFQGKLSKNNINRPSSDIGDPGSKNISITVTEDVIYSPKNSPSDIVLEPIGRSLSGRWSKTSSPLALLESDLSNFHDMNEPSTVSAPDGSESKEQSTTQSGTARPAIQSYSMSKRQTDISNVHLPHSAALFYCGSSPQMEVVESCGSIYKLNVYLKARRADVNAGVPGRFLRAVIGPDIADVGSVVSTIMYAFYLDETLGSNEFCTVPVINMKRADLGLHADLQWLIFSCHIDLSSLIFVDEIDFSYYDLFGSLKLVLLNCDKIPSEQEALREAIVEVFHCTKSDNSYPWVDSITVRQDVSCCTVIAEKFAMHSPVILAGQGFSRLLLAGILLDTENLSRSQCTSKDKYMATLLINGAGRFGCNGLYQILKHKTSGSSDLTVEEILRKEFKKWTRSGKPNTSSSRLLAPNVGMSSIGMSVAQLLSYNSTTIQEIIHFQKLEKLGLLLVVSGYYDSQKKFKREVLLSAGSAEVMKSLLLFLNSNAALLPLKALDQPGLEHEMRVFEIDKVTSRRTIERLLEEFLPHLNNSL
ncbi:protein prune homolog [Sesamum indicum]|uniref:protein prune homolog n=1 Tax=Sesamum indicum TaxID=4182 RepID=A0A6I9UEK0_SESIN|nr:protein prune homolog [Sesamum indicum]XP_011096720.1 protein prune homolog [Sesamum indicum]